MASNYTSNYKLNQWAASDKVFRAEFNEDNVKLDIALAGKADVSVLAEVDRKADQSALDVLQNTVTAQGAALELRNCQFAAGSYKDSGTFGEANPNSLSFPHKPVFLHVSSDDSLIFFTAVLGQPEVWHFWNSDPITQTLTWGKTSISWHTIGGAHKQLNALTKTYHYFTILEVE